MLAPLPHAVALLYRRINAAGLGSASRLMCRSKRSLPLAEQEHKALTHLLSCQGAPELDEGRWKMCLKDSART